MPRPPKVAKLLAQSIPLVLEVDEGKFKLPLKLSWNMKAVLLIEERLRRAGIPVNILQDLRGFWANLDCTKLTAAVWACALQDSPEFSDEEGFDVISSFITPDNSKVAAAVLWDAFLASLSPERRAALQQAAEEQPQEDPTPAPAQS